MQDQQKANKVTLYLPSELHRQLKIRSAVDGEAMSAIAERALEFYMSHAEVVNDHSEGYGQTHRLYSCPSCSEPLVVRDGELMPIQVAIAPDQADDLPVAMQGVATGANLPDEGELVTC